MGIEIPEVWQVILGIAVAIPLGVVVLLFLVMPVCRAVAFLVGRVAKFVVAMLTDGVRLVGIVLTALVMVPLTALAVVLGRWSRAQHYGRAVGAEFRALGAAMYRLAVGHPLRLFGLQGLVEGLEQRVPQAMAAAPPATGPVGGVGSPVPGGGVGGGASGVGEPTPYVGDPPSGPVGSSRIGQFAGYTIIGTLAGGGSGGRLYIARPDAGKLAALARQGFAGIGDVVIKAFSVKGGSSLPQIVRESRALEAAKKLGLVLEHELTDQRFFYVMRYVPGDALGLVTQRLHARAPQGLGRGELTETLGYVADLLGTLHHYHTSGMWHKDVKPDNIIVSAGRAHLVDFGLVTPLRSSMTLTTHGTEYFRDPELVRMALRGVKVHEVDGAKFDVYAVGAVLFSMLENSFPAHGGLSQITRPCPEALRWVVRRAMTDYDKRYPTAQAMLDDVNAALAAARAGGLSAMRPADLPSVRAGELDPAAVAGAAVGAAGGFVPGVAQVGAADPGYGALGSRVIPAMAPMPPLPPPPPEGARFAGAGAVGTPRPARGAGGVSAREQVKSARARAAQARERVRARFASVPRASTGVNLGVAGSAAAVVAAVAIVSMVIFVFNRSEPAGVPLAAPPAVVAAVPPVLANGVVVVGAAAGGVGGETPPVAVAARRSRRERAAAHAGVTPTATPVVPEGPRPLVLVLQEPAGFDEAGVAGIRAGLRAIQGAGFALVGSTVQEGDGSASPNAEGVDSLRLAAELRNAVGLRSLPSAEANAAIAQWLEKQEAVHAVLWIARDAELPGRSIKLLVMGPDAPSALAATVQRAFPADRQP